MKKAILSLLLLSLIPNLYALQLMGTLIDNSNGNYSVTITTMNGDRQFIGNANRQANGDLTITVNGQSNETYIGIAKPNGDSTYTMSLKNNATGELATGQLQLEE